MKRKLLPEGHLIVFRIVAEVCLPQVPLLFLKCFRPSFTECHILSVIMILKTWKIFLNVITEVCNSTRSLLEFHKFPASETKPYLFVFKACHIRSRHNYVINHYATYTQ